MAAIGTDFNKLLLYRLYWWVETTHSVYCLKKTWLLIDPTWIRCPSLKSVNCGLDKELDSSYRNHMEGVGRRTVSGGSRESGGDTMVGDCVLGLYHLSPCPSRVPHSQCTPQWCCFCGLTAFRNLCWLLFFITVTKYLLETTQGRRDLFWLTVWRVQPMVSWFHVLGGGRVGWRRHEAEEKGDISFWLTFSFSLFNSVWTPNIWGGPSHTLGRLSSVSKHLHEHPEVCFSSLLDYFKSSQVNHQRSIHRES